MSSSLPKDVATAAIPSGDTNQADELLPMPIKQLKLFINPSYLQQLKDANILGYQRPLSNCFSKPRYYEINIENFRVAMCEVLKDYLIWKYHEISELPSSQIISEMNLIAPICADACMTALYAKLHTIHKYYGTYAARFSSPPTYSKDLELPLPFADAIQNFGVFETRSMLSNYFMIPVYPEGAKYEGRSSEDWHYSKYESCLHLLKECGIPLKSVDTSIKDGCAWWTYKIREVCSTFDFQCIIPFLHYTDHSAILSSMFLLVDGNTKSLLPIIKHHTDDQDYGVRLREVLSGFPFQSFSALCHASKEVWEFLY